VGCEIPEDLPLSEVIQMLDATGAAFCAVVNAVGRTTGIISAEDVNEIRHEEFPAGLVIANDIAAPFGACSHAAWPAGEQVVSPLVGSKWLATWMMVVGEPRLAHRERIMESLALFLAVTFIAAYYGHIL